MSFRQFGGLNYAAKHNIVSSNYNTSNNLLVTQNIGQPNSYINFLSDISGNISVYGDFDLSGNLHVSQNIDVSGNINVGGNIDLSGNSNIGGNVDISGNSNIGGNVDITGNSNIGGNVDISGNSNIGGNVDITGNSNIGGNIDISGNLTAYYMFLSSAYNYSVAENAVMPKSYIDLVSTINIDSSLNFINYLDSTIGNTGASGNLALGTLSTNTIIGPTGGNPVQFQSQIQAQKGITGPTGSFTNLTASQQIIALGGITGATGSFTNLNVSNNTNFVNLPTSTQTPTTGDQLITKSYADSTYTTYGNILGSNNSWTGINTFSNNTLVPGGITGATGSFSYLNSSALDVSGNGNFSGSVTASSFNATSDYRIKDNIQILNEYHNVDNLRPITYYNKKTGKQDIGLLAHEVQEYLPCLVIGEKDVEQLQNINYLGLIPILIKEIQELKKEIKILKTKI